MADDTQLSAPVGTGDVISTDDLGTKKVQRVKVQHGVDGSATDASATNPLPVDQTNTSVADGGTLPAKGVQVGGTDGSVFQVLSTDSAGRLNANINGTVPVSAASLPLPAGASTAAKQPALGTAGTASADVISVQGVASMTPIKVDGSGVTQPVSGTVTASGPLTDAQLRATAVPVSGPLTDTQLRATAVPVSGTVTASGPLTDTQLRATPVPVSGTVTANLGTAAVTNAGTFAVQIAANSSVNQAQVAGTATDTNSGVKSAGTQRIVIATDQPALTNALKVDGSAVTQPVSGTVTANAGSGPFPVSDNSGSLTVDAPVGTPVFTTVTPSTTGGWSKQMYAAQTTTVRTVKGTAGTWGGYGTIYNPNAGVAYVQVFDVATATTVTLGTTVPDMIIPIPAGSAANMEVVNGVNMALGIKLACTTTATGSTAPTTGLDMTVFFK